MFPPGETRARASCHPLLESKSCECFENNRLSLKKKQQQKAICFFYHDRFICWTLEVGVGKKRPSNKYPIKGKEFDNQDNTL
jgi:hypothetical protein